MPPLAAATPRPCPTFPLASRSSVLRWVLGGSVQRPHHHVAPSTASRSLLLLPTGRRRPCCTCSSSDLVAVYLCFLIFDLVDRMASRWMQCSEEHAVCISFCGWISNRSELPEKSQQKNKSEVSSPCCNRAMKGTLTERPDKKLTHRIRQKRTKEVKNLLEKPDHEIDHMKLSVMHVRLLQEARERIKSKTIPSGPSSSNQSSKFGDTNSFDPFGENYDNDGTENHVLENATRLNYHSYMNKQAHAKWSKSDTYLFYQGLQQFGSDFAMIQQLFPDKSRDQVRQKFKTEEKKHPMQVHDAILHRSRDNLYLKQVIKQLNTEDLQRDMNSTHKQVVASSEGDTGNEHVLQDFMEEEDASNWSDKELGTCQSEFREGEHVSGNADDDLDLDVFDWY